MPPARARSEPISKLFALNKIAQCGRDGRSHLCADGHAGATAAMTSPVLALPAIESVAYLFTHVSVIVSGLPPEFVTDSTVRVLPSADNVASDVPNGWPFIFRTV